jgi:hypothetical protein
MFLRTAVDAFTSSVGFIGATNTFVIHERNLNQYNKNVEEEYKCSVSQRRTSVDVMASSVLTHRPVKDLFLTHSESKMSFKTF